MPKPNETTVVLYLPQAPWPSLSAQVQSHVIDQAHRHAGRWQPSSVRLDLPPALAQAPAREYAALLAWLQAQHLQPLLLGSRRADVRLQIR